MRSLLLQVTTLLVLCALSWFHVHAQECSLTDPVAIDQDGHVLLEQAKHKEQDGTYTMRLTYLGGHAWIGIGRNKWGINHMTPGLAVIGRADAAGTTKDGEDGNVQFYELKSDAEDGSGVLPKVAASSLEYTFAASTLSSRLR